MARKTADMLRPKIKHVPLSATGKAFLAQLASRVPEEGFEEQWNRYLAVAREHEQAFADLSYWGDKVDAECQVVWDKSKGEERMSMASAPSYDDMHAAELRYQRATKASFGALDTYQHGVKHKDDVPEGPLVPEEDTRAVVCASMSDHAAVFGWTAKYGIVGSAVARAIRMDVADTDEDAPYCGDCQ